MGVIGVMVNCALIAQSGLVQRFMPDLSWGGQILMIVLLEVSRNVRAESETIFYLDRTGS